MFKVEVAMFAQPVPFHERRSPKLSVMAPTSESSSMDCDSASRVQVTPPQENSPKSSALSIAAVTSFTLSTPPAVNSRASPEILVTKSLPSVSCVVEAFSKTDVDDAKREERVPRKKRGGEVALVVV